MRIALFFIGAALFAQPPYNGVVNGSITFGAGGASGFSSSNYIALPAGVLNTSCITAEAWVNPANVSAWQWILTNFPASTPTVSFGVAIGGSIYGGFGSGAAAGFTVATGTDQHFAVQQCSDVITFFVNGVQRYTGATTGPYASNAASRIGQNTSAGEVWTGSIRHLTIWNTARYTVSTNGTTVFTPAASYTGSEGMRAYYPLTSNANDITGAPALTAGGLAPALGLLVGAATGGTSPYTYQLQSYAGACASGTFATDGAALTGQTGAATFARADATTKCYRVLVTDAASATATSNSLTAPVAGGGMRSY